jgi:phosphate transport system substrate-binding protein
MSTASSGSRRTSGARRFRRRHLGAIGALSLLASVGGLFAGQLPAAASPSLQSTGSSFASIAIQQWVGQASTLYGLNINWQVQSSVIGLDDFAQNQVDLGASDIPYSSMQATSNPDVPYQYLPDVAGGLAFMYNLTGNDGQRISNLNLNPQVSDAIFLGKVDTWNSPAIAAINPQLAGDLPPTKIIPVYRSDASGENYLLSDYMLHEDPSSFLAAQNAFQSPLPGQPNANWPTPSSSVNVGSPPFSTTYPGWAQSNLIGQNGSDNAANYVSAVSSVGSITYVETAYAKVHNLPVASVVNQSGSAVQPTSVNVATALEAAVLHPDLTQDLSQVYVNPLPNAYPLSAYSYLVSQCSPALAVAQHASCAADPNGASSNLPASKGQALGQFVSYLACGGQEKMALLGYSPLPPNLVQEDFYAVGRLPGGQEPPPVSAADCKNPYVDGEIPLPGEPAIVGQAGGGLQAAAAAQAAATAAAAAAAAKGNAVGGHSGSGSGSGSHGGSGSGSGSGTGAGSGSGTAGLSAAQIAEGYRLVNGQVVKTSPCEGSERFACATALVDATSKVDGLPVADLVGWLLVAVVLFAGIPLIAVLRRRRAAGADMTDLAEHG